MLSFSNGIPSAPTTLKRHPELGRGRLVVDNPDHADRMTLHCELDRPPAGFAEAVATSIRELTKLRGEVVFCAPGSLANDGRIIDDIRKYE